MVTKVWIAYEVSDEKVAQVQAMLDELVLRDVDFNGAVFQIERDEHTCLGEFHDEAAAEYLFGRVLDIIDGTQEHEA
jgi:hypothetical protein